MKPVCGERVQALLGCQFIPVDKIQVSALQQIFFVFIRQEELPVGNLIYLEAVVYIRMFLFQVLLPV